MSNNLMGESMMIAFAGLGINFEYMEETQESLTLYISVPETSYTKDVHGIEMSGTHLAKRYKDTLVSLGVKRLTVKSRIRKGENWTEANKKEAELKYKKKLFGSQY